jgi:Flp pilus assembly pilin Flp
VGITDKPLEARSDRPAPAEYAFVLAVICAVVVAALTLLSGGVREALSGLL